MKAFIKMWPIRNCLHNFNNNSDYNNMCFDNFINICLLLVHIYDSDTENTVVPFRWIFFAQGDILWRQAK